MTKICFTYGKNRKSATSPASLKCAVNSSSVTPSLMESEWERMNGMKEKMGIKGSNGNKYDNGNTYGIFDK